TTDGSAGGSNDAVTVLEPLIFFQSLILRGRCSYRTAIRSKVIDDNSAEILDNIRESDDARSGALSELITKVGQVTKARQHLRSAVSDIRQSVALIAKLYRKVDKPQTSAELSQNAAAALTSERADADENDGVLVDPDDRSSIQTNSVDESA